MKSFGASVSIFALATLTGCVSSSQAASAAKVHPGHDAAPALTTEYDRFDGTTTLRTGDLKLGGGATGILASIAAATGPYAFTVKASYTYHDGAPAPGSVLLAFSSSSESWQFLEYHSLILLADGQRLAFGEGDHKGDFGRHGVWELVFFHPPLDQLRTIARAKVVEGRLGGYEFRFGDAQLAALREFTRVADSVASVLGAGGQ